VARPGNPEAPPAPPQGRPPPLRAFRLRLKALRSVGLPCGIFPTFSTEPATSIPSLTRNLTHPISR